MGDLLTPAFGPLLPRKDLLAGLLGGTLSLMALYCAMSATAIAQQPASSAAPQGSETTATPGATAAPAGRPAKGTAQSEAGEPRAATSADSAAAPTEASPAAGARAAGAPTQAAPNAAASPAARPSAGTSAHGSAHPPGAAAQGGKTATDRLELGTATVTGDREQPKVMYIVPWKKSDIGDLSGKPMNSLLDEALSPVDRDEFKRQVMYYQVVKADASQNGASKAPAAQGEK